MAFEVKSSIKEDMGEAMDEVLEHYKIIGKYDKICSIKHVETKDGEHFFSVHLNDTLASLAS